MTSITDLVGQGSTRPRVVVLDEQGKREVRRAALSGVCIPGTKCRSGRERCQ